MKIFKSLPVLLVIFVAFEEKLYTLSSNGEILYESDSNINRNAKSYCLYINPSTFNEEIAFIYPSNEINRLNVVNHKKLGTITTLDENIEKIIFKPSSTVFICCCKDFVYLIPDTNNSRTIKRKKIKILDKLEATPSHT